MNYLWCFRYRRTVKKNNETDFDGGGIELQRAYYTLLVYMIDIFTFIFFSGYTITVFTTKGTRFFIAVQSSPTFDAGALHAVATGTVATAIQWTTTR